MPQTLKSITIAGQKFEVGSENIHLYNQGTAAGLGRLLPGQNLLQWFQTNAASLNLLTFGQQAIYIDTGTSFQLADQDYNTNYLPFILVATYLGIRQSVLPQEGEAIGADPTFPQGMLLKNTFSYERVDNVKEIITLSIENISEYEIFSFEKKLGLQTLEEFLQSIVNNAQENSFFRFKLYSFTTLF